MGSLKERHEAGSRSEEASQGASHEKVCGIRLPSAQDLKVQDCSLHGTRRRLGPEKKGFRDLSVGIEQRALASARPEGAEALGADGG